MKTDPANQIPTVAISHQDRLNECTLKVRGLLYLLATAVVKSDEGPFNGACEDENEGINYLSYSIGQDLADALHAAFETPEHAAQAPASAPVSESLPESRISGDAPDLAPMRPKSAARVLQRGSGVLQRGSAESPDSHPAASAV
jgi:hypothetical protein